MNSTFDEKRQEILSAALRVFSLYTYGKATMDDIAADVGMKKNSLYYYFPNKEALFTEVINEAAEKLISMFEEICSKKINAETKIKKILKVLVHFLSSVSKEHPLTVEAALEAHIMLKRYYSQHEEKVKGYMVNTLKEGIDNGEFIKHNSRELGYLLLDLYVANEFVLYHTTDKKFISEIDYTEFENTVLKAADYIIAGVKK